MIDRRHIGFTTQPSQARVEPWRVKLFCQAIGESDPKAWQPDAPLPPTFLKAIEGEHYSSAALLQLLQVPMQRVLHAEQAFEHHAPVRVGDTVQVRRRIADIHDKKNGTMEFIVIDTLFSVGGRDVATARQTVLVRHPATATS